MDDRHTDLEVKVAYLEHHVAQLDGLLREALERIDSLGRELGRVDQRVDALATEGSPGGHERPPHHLPAPLDR